MSGLPEREKAILQRLKGDFPHYAAKCLKIRPKAGGLIPLELNRVQRFIHERLEAQLAETGRVRALILKMRQPGCSTLVEGRYYWRVTQRHGVRAFILTHTQDATDNLFGMVERFHENCPAPVCPQTGKSNAKELAFPLLDSGYRVGTAGTEGVGRSDTIQFFHGSEVAYWKNADSHMAGVLQAVPDESGTEIILESTANGLGGLFYSMCKAAERGESDYILIFLPWFWHDEYRKAVPEGWQPPTDFHDYAEIHGLDPEQVHWAYTKNRDLAQSIGADSDKICWKFRQEYPATAEEAFQTGSDQTFISSQQVAQARRNRVQPHPSTGIVVGVDCGRGGRGKTRIYDRQGRCLGGHIDITLDTDDLMQVAGVCARVIDKLRQRDLPFRQMFVDVGGLGAGVYDRLREMGYGDAVTPVNFGQKPLDPRKYANKRAEMWTELRDWLGDPAGVDVPDDDDLHTQLCAPIWGPAATRHNSNDQIILEPKEHIEARLGFSPDAADAAALTFAFPVGDFDEENWGKTQQDWGNYGPGAESGY